MAGYSNRAWTCPFFRWDERLCVRCDGGCMNFPDRATLTEYADHYCASVEGWKGCTMAASLLKYYDRKDE